MSQDTRSKPAPPDAPPVRASFDRFELDQRNATLTRDGTPIPLAPTPFAVLCALVRQQGSLVTKNALLDEVWGHRFVTESVLKTVIGKLRTALEDDARQPRFIETVSRRGYRFIGRTTTAAPRAGPAAPLAHPPHDAGFIGRADALRTLFASWERACNGQRAIVWISGEPGIGKSALIRRLVGSIPDAACIHGQCVEQYGKGEPYLPVLEALGQLCRRDASVIALLRAVAPTWLLQLPWLLEASERDALRREFAGIGPERMLREMGELLDRYTAGSPLMLVTEDLHWSDRSTLELLNYIARRQGSSRLMWLASFRLSEVVALDHPVNPLRRELRLHGLCEEIVLDPFSESEVEQYIARQAPAIAADESFVRALHERTDGVPLFVSHVLDEVLQASGERSAPPALAAKHIAGMGVPENLAAIIDHYLDKVTDEQRELLAAAAVCGVEFPPQTLADVLESDAATVSARCDALVRERLWLARATPRGDDAADAPYSFRHALFHQVVYERTNAAARAALHARAGRALERSRASGAPVAAAELAMHFERGREPLAALRHYAEAAEAALLHFSPAEGQALAERGLRLIPLVPAGLERDEAQISLATLQGASTAHTLGVCSAETKAAYEHAFALLPALPHHRFRGLLLHGLGLALCDRAEYAEAFAFAERCTALASQSDDPVLLLGACTVQAGVLMLQGRPREGREWAERGLAAIASGKAPADETFAPHVTLLGFLGMHLLHLGDIATARGTLRDARARADRSGQPIAKSIAIWFEALLEVRLGDAARVDVLAAEMKRLVEECGFAEGRAAWRWFHGWARARGGDAREGHALIKSAYEDNTRAGMLSGGSEVVGYGAEALLLAGDLDGASRELAQAFSIARALGERVYLPQLLSLEAAIARCRGRPDDANAAARRAVDEARAQQSPWLELHALLELVQGAGARRENRQALAALLARMKDAGDTPAYARARSAIAKA